MKSTLSSSIPITFSTIKNTLTSASTSYNTLPSTLEQTESVKTSNIFKSTSASPSSYISLPTTSKQAEALETATKIKHIFYQSFVTTLEPPGASKTTLLHQS